MLVLLIVATVFAQDDANATSTTTTTTTTSLPTQEAVVGNATQAADGGDNADGNVQNDDPAAGDVSTPAAENVAVSEANANAESQTGTFTFAKHFCNPFVQAPMGQTSLRPPDFTSRLHFYALHFLPL